MELKAKLNKPFNNKQRCDFIVEQNHRLGFEIRKVKNGLEAWGMTQEEQEEFEIENKKTSVRQYRNNLLDETDKFVSIPDFPIDSKTKELYIEYRQYLRDYTKLKDWWKQEPKTFEKLKK